MSNYDVVVLGLGGLGSSCLYHLSKNPNLNVLGIDQYGVAHDKGSSCGEIRMFRKAYFEEEKYIPLLDRALENWRILEQESGEELFNQSGLLLMTPEKGDKAKKILAAAEKYNIDFEVLTRKQTNARYPAFELPEGWISLWEREAGFLYVEKAVQTFINQAQSNGAELSLGTKVTGLNFVNQEFTLTLNEKKVSAKKLIISAGAWLQELLPNLQMSLKIERAPQFWFSASSDIKLPCYAFDYGEDFIYGFPGTSLGYKIASYRPAEQLGKPPCNELNYQDSDLECINKVKTAHLPFMTNTLSHYKNCFYTTTEDENFIFDQYQEDFPALIVGAGSGHAFKFSSILGELAAKKIADQEIEYDLNFLKIR